MDFLKNVSMCVKKVKLIIDDCVTILILLYIVPYIMLAYLMLLASLSNAGFCIMLFIAFDFCKCVLFSCFVLVC